MKADNYRLRIERFNQGLTQRQLAEKAGISLRTMVKAEHGGDITATTHGAILKALGLV